jgi:hypothetical protein
MLNKFLAKDTHKPGKNDQFWFALVYRLLQCLFEFLATAKCSVVNRNGGNASITGTIKSCNSRAVTDNSLDIDIEFITLHGVDNGLQVAAPARDQDDNRYSGFAHYRVS